jgi:hypothetical protein
MLLHHKYNKNEFGKLSKSDCIVEVQHLSQSRRETKRSIAYELSKVTPATFQKK